MIRSANIIASVSRKAGGLFESVRRLAQSLAQSGMSVKVFGILDEFSQDDMRAWSPIRVSALKAAGPAAFGYSPRLIEEIMAFRPDVIHSHGLWLYPSIAAHACFRRTSKPYMISPHGMLDPWALANSRWKKVIAQALFEGRHLRHARCLRALCASEAISMRQCQLTNSIAVIPNGIDLPLESPSARAPWDVFIAPGAKILLYLGRIHPKKGIANLFKAWSVVQKTDPHASTSNWVLAIAGWEQGGHERELKQLATELNIDWADVRRQPSPRSRSSSVIFLGPQFQAAKAACYGNCDAFVLPSVSEGLPMVALESWAYSKLVLMTPQCNLPEGFSAAAALRIDAEPESIADGLQKLFRMSDNERVAMGQRGRVLVADRFSWPRISDQMNEAYQWMVGGGPKPACVSDF